MKKTFIKRLAAIILFAMTGANLFSQGFYVYTKDGQRQDYPSENVDSIVFYEKTVEDDVSAPGEAIDLGLPSGLKWASCNVGASSPEEYGGYFAWGEIEEKSDYSWDTYKWCKGSSNSMTKYCINSNYGTVDNKTILDPEDDVAHVKWGGNWRMPTLDEIKEFVYYCSRKWTTYNGVNGLLFTGPNGNSIFIPTAGCRVGTEVKHRDLYGNILSASLYSNNNELMYTLNFSNDYVSWDDCYGRGTGRSVRPVSD